MFKLYNPFMHIYIFELLVLFRNPKHDLEKI